MAEFLMPSLGADMERGTIVEWRVAPGDAVRRGDVVAVVDTEKSDIEVEVFEDGVVDELLVATGREVPVGTPLARLVPAVGPEDHPAERTPGGPSRGRNDVAGASRGSDADSAGPSHHDAAESPPVTRAAPTPPPTPAKAGPASSGPAPVERVRASPRARRRALDIGMDLAAVVGSGPDGAVTASDVDQAAVTPRSHGVDGAARHGPSGAERSLAARRRATGELMARASREIPHYYLSTTIDMLASRTWLDQENAHRTVQERILPAALLLRATARAAVEVPGFNGTWSDGYRPASHVDLGVAIALRGGGLVAPAIPEAESLGLEELMTRLGDIVQRARSGHLRSSEVAGATLTVTYLGDQGADEVFGLIHPPQVALVGFGRVRERPWASGGMVGARPTVRATLAADHRSSDGIEGSRFLAAIDRHLQEPEDLR